MSAGPSRQDSAQCEVTIAASDGGDKHIDGHYSWVLVREGGSWKFRRDAGDEGTGYNRSSVLVTTVGLISFTFSILDFNQDNNFRSGRLTSVLAGNPVQ